MGTISQLTFFAALALLAIVITIFVFAISLLGRAMEAAAKSEKEKLAERKENNAKEMAAIKEEIEEAEAKGEIPRGLTRKLKKLEKRDKKFGKELSKIRAAPELLTVKGGVLPVGASLLGALILSGGAWYLTNIQIFIWIVPVLIWILGLVAIGFSVSRIYQSLKVIENVAITSEEAALKRTVEAFKIAQREIEEERKPELRLGFEGQQPPFHVAADAEMKIEFGVSLIKGEIADDVCVGFFVPPGFSFPGKKSEIQRASHSVVPKFITAWVDYAEPVRSGICLGEKLVFKAPSKAGRFEAYYLITCRGFKGEYEKFEITVE